MQRRKFLTAMGSLAAGGAAVMGSGAFEAVQADRDITVAIEGDDDAYLGFTNLDNNYATYDSKGRLVLSFTDNGNGGMGLNQTADTRINDVFRIVNQGTNPAYIWIALEEPESGAAQSTQVLADDDGNTDIDLTDGDSTRGYISLNPGNSRSIDFLFNVTGSLPPRTESGVFQFRALDTSNSAPSQWPDDWDRNGVQAGQNGNGIGFL